MKTNESHFSINGIAKSLLNGLNIDKKEAFETARLFFRDTRKNKKRLARIAKTR